MKKIMFNDEYGLTDAVLKGRKTMTRRIIRNLSNFDPRQDWVVWGNNEKGKANIAIFHNETYKYCIYPQYQPGEVVAVAQSYKDLKLSYIPHIDEPDFKTCTKHAPQWGNPRGMKGWNNKMFVRPDLMPHQIQITNIKVERLQDISEEDCLKEGIQEYFPYIDRDPNDKVRTFRYFKDGKIRHCISPASKCFAYLIDDVSGKGTWERNPYVFAYSFELVK